MMMCTYARRYWDWSIVVAVMMLLPQLLANGAWAQDKPKIEIVPGTGHFEGINAVAVSPEGARVLSGGWDGSVKLWDVATGRLIHTFTAGTETVFRLPSHRMARDSSRVTETGRQSCGTQRAGSSSVRSRTRILLRRWLFPRMGRRMFWAGFRSNGVRLWDATTGQLIRVIENRHATSVAISPDGTGLLASGADDDTSAGLWDAATGRLVRTFKGGGRGILAVAFSPDGLRILTGDLDRAMKLWDVATERLVRTIDTGSLYLDAVRFSPDGTRFVSGDSLGDQVKVWDEKTGQLLRSFEAKVDFGSVSLSTDGGRLLLVDKDDHNSVKLWDVATGQLIRTFKGRSLPVSAVALSADGRRALWAGGDAVIKLGDVTSGKVVRTFQGHTANVGAVAFSPDGARVLSGSWDKTLKLWDATTGQLIEDSRGIRMESALSLSRRTAVACYRAATTVRSGSGMPRAENSCRRSRWDPGPCDQSLSLPTAPASCREAKTKSLRLWDAKSGQPIRTFGDNSHFILAVAFSPDGRQIAAGTWDKPIKLWDAATGKLIRTLDGHSDYVTSLAFSPDGTRLVSGSLDKTIKLWRVETGQLLATFESRLLGTTYAPASSRSGNRYSFPGRYRWPLRGVFT